MLFLSPLLVLFAVGAASGDAPEANWLFYGGIGVGVAGGIMIARADSTSPINVRDERPDEPGQQVRFPSR